jgi:hypothetical protein
MSIAETKNEYVTLAEVLARLQSGVRDPEAGLRALAILAKEREELRKKIGTVDLAVELVRATRDKS